MNDHSAALYKLSAGLLAALGLGAYLAAGVTSGDWGVARLTIVDPLIVVAACMTVAWLFGERLRAALRRAYDGLMRVPAPALLIVVAITIVVSATIVSRLAFAGQPAVTDELTQAFQGRILLSGHIAAHAEQYGEFFETPQTVRRMGRWFSEYPIGSGALAAFGDLTQLAWLLSPLLTAIAAMATFAFARRAYGEATARIALILVALSPFAVFMSASRMSHVPTLTLTAIALAALARWDMATAARERAWSATVIGAAIGAMVLLRPYDAILIALPIGVFQLAAVVRRRDGALSLAPQIIVASLIASFQLWVNAQTTGSALLFGYDAINGAAHRPGFHVDPLGFAFTPARGLDLVMLYLNRLNTSLFESTIPAVFFIAAAMWLTRPTRWDWLLAGMMFSLLAGYGIYWFDGSFVGPRFLFPALVTFVVFTARFVILSSERARQSRAALGATLLVPVCIVVALMPQSWGNRSTGVLVRLESMRRNPVAQSPDPAADVGRAGLTNALVFVREPLHARITARLRALGMAPYDAERTAADLDACSLLSALARADARPDVPASQRLTTVFRESQTVDRPQMISGMVGAAALSLARGAPSSEACRAEINDDRYGVDSYDRFLATATFDSSGQLGGNVVVARYLGARDTILRSRFGDRAWYLYRREPGTRTGRFVPYRLSP